MPRSARPFASFRRSVTLLVACFVCAVGFAVESRPELISKTGGGSPWSTIAQLTTAADKGNPKACAQLGEMLLRGSEEVKQDGPRALILLEKAARAGEASAAFRLGMLLETGDGVVEDHPRAVAYLRAAAVGGVAEAFRNVGVAYSTARGGVKRDYTEALGWLILAGKHGSAGTVETDLRAFLKKIGRTELIPAGERRAPEIERELGQTTVAQSLPPPGALAYVKPGQERPGAVPTSPGKAAVADVEDVPGEPPVKLITPTGRARRWPTLAALERAADQGSLDALSAFGQILTEGKLLPADTLRGIALLEQAAKAGSADAASHLGELYTKGTRIYRDDVKGFDYTLQAARGGARTAMHNLGALYAGGQGVAINYPEALVWLLVAKHYNIDSGQAGRMREYLLKTQPGAVPVAEKRAADHIREIDKVRE